MTDAIAITNEGQVRTITLNRPEKMNALNEELAWAIVGAVDEAAKDDSVWVVAITGNGRAFSAGLDLTAFAGEKSYAPLSPMTRQLDDLAWISRFHPRHAPVVR